MILVYGSYGYTGQLVCQQIRALGLPMVEAGRSVSKLNAGGRAFALDEPAEISRNLSDVRVILNCAGPFSSTGEPLARAAVETGVHYLDLAGEVPEFEALRQLDGPARERDVMLMPGVGFGIIPTDCLLARALSQVENPNAGVIGYETVGGASRGTLGNVFGRDASGGISS